MKLPSKSPTRSSKPGLLALAFLGLLVGGCVNVQSTAFPVGQRRPPKSALAEVQFFPETPPERRYEPVAKLNVHIEKTFFLPSAMEEARPKLEDLARQHGADALIGIAEKKSRLNETFIYNVSATAVVFIGDETNQVNQTGK
jgi:hypothetical protein